ncbi:hypothetical protein DL546_007040 [Coniochaeta pulveracea]|nr:hypothetical protein DL546_007040 [Coniochaeta pulveracea]
MSNTTSPTVGTDTTTDSPSPSPTTSALPTTAPTSSDQLTTSAPTDTTTPTTAPNNPTTSTPQPVTTPTPTPESTPTPTPTSTPTPTPEPSTSITPTTTSISSAPVAPTTTSTTQQPPTTSQAAPTTLRTTTSVPASTIIVTQAPSGTKPATTITSIEYKTIVPSDTTSATGSATSSSSSSSSTAIGVKDPTPGGLNTSGKVAVGVVVPIAGVALLVLAGIYFWRKRKQRKELEEQRRKEVEDYAYNPNADPTIPAVGAYEMKDDSPGYRGWGSTTAAGSTGRKASTTMSGGVGGPALSDTATTPTFNNNVPDSRSGEQLMDGSQSPEGEILGAMGPSAAANRTSDVHRGPSNASSSYSAAARSDGSDNGIGVAYGSGGSYGYDQYGGANPYADGTPQAPAEVAGTPVIRDVAARRNTRIENPSHYPQQTAGISQNF